MIDRDMHDLFPPHWMPDSCDSALVWRWTDGLPADADPVMVLARADGQGFSIIGAGERPSGTGLVANEHGLAFRLSASDAALLRETALIFGVWSSGMVGPPDALGQLFVSDWTAQPHRGTA